MAEQNARLVQVSTNFHGICRGAQTQIASDELLMEGILQLADRGNVQEIQRRLAGRLSNRYANNRAALFQQGRAQETQVSVGTAPRLA